jgi:hypothetical protein
VRAKQLPNARTFDELLPEIGECCRRLDEGKSVLIINGNNKDDAPNFEKARVWKILVGGTKLSRGYTVEGLTVSYYRRRAGAADTLMQMGRWFGFRRGYQDLVRLYIGKSEPVTKKGTRFINLYEAFRATCQDEEQFRQQLKRYSSLRPGERITPKQVPPLVTQHMLPPTSKNKMFNARITFTNFGGDWIEKTVAPADDEQMKHNERIMRTLLLGTALHKSRIATDGMKQGSFDAWTAALPTTAMREFLEEYRWLPGFKGVLTTVKEFLKGHGDHDPQIDTWLFLAPQLKSSGKTQPLPLADKQFDVRERARVETGGRYKAYSEPDHRRAAEVFAGVEDGVIGQGGADLRQERQAVLLFYPVRSPEESKCTPTMGFALLFPKNSIKKQIVYTVADPTRSDAVVVPVS